MKEKNEAESIPSKIRKHLHKTVTTHPTEEIKIPKAEVEQPCTRILRPGLQRKQGWETQICTEYEQKFKPVQPRFRNIPIHYQERVSALLNFLREQKVITDVDPRKSYECIMNVVITDKKEGQIRMNIDAVPMNKGLME